MGHDNGREAATLSGLLEISRLQRRLAAENRIEELLSSQAERDALFSMLDLTGGGGTVLDSSLKELASELAESDQLLSAEVSRVMESVGSRLGQVKTGMSAVKAYGRY